MNDLLKKIIIGSDLYSQGFKKINCWWFLGYQEILLKYRRSILGPWWATITVALLIILLSFLWSKIFGLQLDANLVLRIFRFDLLLPVIICDSRLKSVHFQRA